MSSVEQDPDKELLEASDVREAWPALSVPERVEAFHQLVPSEAEGFFLSLGARDQSILLKELPPGERRLWMRLLAPDDAADVIQGAPAELRDTLLGLLDEPTRKEVS